MTRRKVLSATAIVAIAGRRLFVVGDVAIGQLGPGAREPGPGQRGAGQRAGQ